MSFMNVAKQNNRKGLQCSDHHSNGIFNVKKSIDFQTEKHQLEKDPLIYFGIANARHERH